MSGIYVDGSRAFVALEELDHAGVNYVSKRLSQMAIIDTDKRVLVSTVTLSGRNPFGHFAVDGGMLYLADPGNFDVANEPSAGLERFDPKTLTSVLLVPEASLLGSSLTEVSVSGNCAIAITADPTPNVNRTSAVVIDLELHRVAATLLQTAGFDLRGVYLDQNSAFIGDRRKISTGFPIHIFPRMANCRFAGETTPAILSLPPVAVGD
jgi:hypothetical protein